MRDGRAGTGLRRRWIVLGVLALTIVVAPTLAPYDPNVLLDPIHLRSQPASLAHWLGTDPLSRDVFSRLLVGARTSLLLALTSSVLAGVFGTAVGLLSGYAGGWVDRVFMRTVDVLLAVPRVLLLLTIVGTWGAPSLPMLIAIFACTGWMGVARLVRNEARLLRTRDYVTAAQSVGQRTAGILQHHLAPAVLPLVLVWMGAAVGQLLLLESGLTFLGAGVREPMVSWGTVLLDLSDVVGPARWLLLAPGLLLVATVLLTYRLTGRDES